MGEVYCPTCKILLSAVEDDEGAHFECARCSFRKQHNDWVEHHCALCGCDKAEIVYSAMTLGDEDETVIYRCIRCRARSRTGFMAR